MHGETVKFTFHTVITVLVKALINHFNYITLMLLSYPVLTINKSCRYT